jgi:hypothetical protein
MNISTANGQNSVAAFLQKNIVPNFFHKESSAPFNSHLDQVSLSEAAKNKAVSSKVANQAVTQPSEAATQFTTAPANATSLKLWGDSRNSALIPRFFGSYENEKYTQQKARWKEEWVLDMSEFTKYFYTFPPGWYMDAITAPINILQQQGDQVPYSDMDKEQAQALIEEYYQALGESLSRAFDNLGIKTRDGCVDALHSPTKNVKLREEVSRIMYGDSQIRDIMSRLNIDIKSILGVEV